jgi:hypothetical protein
MLNAPAVRSLVPDRPTNNPHKTGKTQKLILGTLLNSDFAVKARFRDRAFRIKAVIGRKRGHANLRGALQRTLKQGVLRTKMGARDARALPHDVAYVCAIPFTAIDYHMTQAGSGRDSVHSDQHRVVLSRNFR